MPIQRKKKSSRPSRRPLARRMRGYRRRNYAPRTRRVNDFAGCSETITFTGQQGLTGVPTSSFPTGSKGTTFFAWHNSDIQLTDFTRAPRIAQAYQYYRIKYFELSIVPDYDTFAAGAGVAGKPMFYYMIDKGSSIGLNVTNQQIKSMGAKPIALDEKPIKIRWSPGVLLDTQIVTSSPSSSAGKYMISPWLRTDQFVDDVPNSFTPSQVCHYGIKFFAENIGATVTYTATLTAHFQFKKPLLTSPFSGEEVAQNGSG